MEMKTVLAQVESFCVYTNQTNRFRLRLPSCGPGFESQAPHQCFFQFLLLKLYPENNENKNKKEAGIGPFKKKQIGSTCKVTLDTYMFDCWADPVVCLLLLKSSMIESHSNWWAKIILIKCQLFCHS